MAWCGLRHPLTLFKMLRFRSSGQTISCSCLRLSQIVYFGPPGCSGSILQCAAEESGRIPPTLRCELCVSMPLKQKTRVLWQKQKYIQYLYQTMYMHIYYIAQSYRIIPYLVSRACPTFPQNGLVAIGFTLQKVPSFAEKLSTVEHRTTTVHRTTISLPCWTWCFFSFHFLFFLFCLYAQCKTIPKIPSLIVRT